MSTTTNTAPTTIAPQQDAWENGGRHPMRTEARRAENELETARAHGYACPRYGGRQQRTMWCADVNPSASSNTCSPGDGNDYKACES